MPATSPMSRLYRNDFPRRRARRRRIQHLLACGSQQFAERALPSRLLLDQAALGAFFQTEAGDSTASACSAPDNALICALSCCCSATVPVKGTNTVSFFSAAQTSAAAV